MVVAGACLAIIAGSAHRQLSGDESVDNLGSLPRCAEVKAFVVSLLLKLFVGSSCEQLLIFLRRSLGHLNARSAFSAFSLRGLLVLVLVVLVVVPGLSPPPVLAVLVPLRLKEPNLAHHRHTTETHA